MKILTVVTVTYNAADCLEPTLLSIIGQTAFEEQIELIVVDGGSRDNTLEIAHRLLDGHQNSCRIVSEPDLGLYDAMNKGSRMATSPWILYMNAGDSLYDEETVVSLQLDKAAPDHIIYGDHIVKHPDGTEQAAKALPFWKVPQFISGIGICHQSIYMPTQWMHVHPFEWKEYPHCADFEAIHYWHSQGRRFHYINRPLCRFEQGNGFSSRPEAQLKLLDENARIIGRRHSWAYYKLWLYYKLGIQGKPLSVDS